LKKDKWIFQKHSNDCGIAALAMLFGTSYSFMRRKVLEQAESRSEPFDGTTSTYAHGIALKLGRRITVQRVQDFPVQTLAQNVKGYPACSYALLWTVPKTSTQCTGTENESMILSG